MNPCELLARVAFDALLPLARAADPTGSGVYDEPDKPATADARDHLAVAAYLRNAAPPEDYAQANGVKWLDRPITWPDRVPGLKTWAGRQTLAQIIVNRQCALGAVAAKRRQSKDSPPSETIPASPITLEQIGSVFDFRAPSGGPSGLDREAAPNSLETGFSTNRLMMEVVTRPALELLAIVGAEMVPLLSIGRRECGFVLNGDVWRFAVELRESGYNARWGMATRQPLLADYPHVRP